MDGVPMLPDDGQSTFRVDSGASSASDSSFSGTGGDFGSDSGSQAATEGSLDPGTAPEGGGSRSTTVSFLDFEKPFDPSDVRLGYETGVDYNGDPIDQTPPSRHGPFMPGLADSGPSESEVYAQTMRNVAAYLAHEQAMASVPGVSAFASDPFAESLARLQLDAADGKLPVSEGLQANQMVYNNRGNPLGLALDLFSATAPPVLAAVAGISGRATTVPENVAIQESSLVEPPPIGDSPAEAYFFRGTTEGYPGGPQSLTPPVTTSTSVQPAVAVNYATYADQFGDGVVQMARGSDMANVPMLSSSSNVGNIRGDFEQGFQIAPSEFALRASAAIPVEAARGILNYMGYATPSRITSQAQLNQVINIGTPVLPSADVKNFYHNASLYQLTLKLSPQGGSR